MAKGRKAWSRGRAWIPVSRVHAGSIGAPRENGPDAAKPFRVLRAAADYSSISAEV